MFSRKITDDIRIELTIPQFAEELFALTDQNRAFLRARLPWLDITAEVAHTRTFILERLEKFARGGCVHVTVFYQDQIADVAELAIDQTNSASDIGYWLGEEFTGRGIMTAVVRDLIDIARDVYHLGRVQIRCMTDNAPSRAIPVRLGFIHEGTLRKVARLYDRVVDLEIHSLLV